MLIGDIHDIETFMLGNHMVHAHYHERLFGSDSNNFLNFFSLKSVYNKSFIIFENML